jgi:8-oxo-dGTP diphosphatase
MLLRVAVSRQTLCYVFRSGEGGRRQVLLGRKKRGFGAGMIMGLGGKAGPGESDAACAVREAGEEAGIVVEPGGLTRSGSTSRHCRWSRCGMTRRTGCPVCWTGRC